MKIKFMAITGKAVCLKAVERDGYALLYVKDQFLFVKIAERLQIEIEL